MIHKGIKESRDYCKKNYKVIKNYKLGFDIGGNIGGFAVAYCDKFDKLISIEAIEENYNEFNKNTKDIKNVIALNKAVSNVSGKTLRFYRWENNDSGSMSSIEVEGRQRKDGYFDVKTINYSDLIKEYGIPEYIKIDCEGCEYDFLLNQNLEGVEFISMELHYNFLSEDQRNELLDYLLKYFDIYHHKLGKIGAYHPEYNLIRK